MQRTLVTVDPKVMHGAACFADTRITFKTLIDYLIEGYTFDGFIEQYPSLNPDLALPLWEAAIGLHEWQHLVRDGKLKDK